MTLDPILTATIAIQIHAFSAIFAFILGIVQFVGTKGTLPHRVFGYLWFALMLAIAISSFWIHAINQWQGFSLIHLLSVYTLIALPPALIAAKRGQIKRHKSLVSSLFIFALLVAGAFTFLPGRIMNKVVTGEPVISKNKIKVP